MGVRLAGALDPERLRYLQLGSSVLSAAVREVLRERFAGTAKHPIRLLVDGAAGSA